MSTRATVTLDGTTSSDPDQVSGGDSEIVSYEWIEGLGSGSPTVLGTSATLDVALPLGAHSIALRVTDACGATNIATTSVVVEDTVAPTFTPAVEPSVLWPPDRRMRTVNVHGTVSDVCDATPSIALTGVTANEPVAGDVAGANPFGIPLDETIFGVDVIVTF